MEEKIEMIKISIIESISKYKDYKNNLLNIFSLLKKDTLDYLKNILKSFDIEKDEKYLYLSSLLFFQHQKWINPFKIKINKYSKHFKLKKNNLHDEKEKIIIKGMNQKNIYKIFVYWHVYILNELSQIYEEKNKNDNISISSNHLIDIENILFQNNNKIINLYNSNALNISEIFVFLYIYLYWIENYTRNNTHEKNLKIINNILFTLFFDLLEKTAEIIFTNNNNIEISKANLNLFFSFLEAIKSNEYINNDYNIIILLDCNIIQKFMNNLLAKINAKILEEAYPTYCSKLSEFFVNFLKFRFNKSNLMDFLLNNIKNGLTHLKYLDSEPDIIMNDIFLQNYQSDLIQKLFSNEDKRLEHPNLNSFLFNGMNSKLSLNLSKLSLNDNLILFSFCIKSNINDKNSYNLNQPLFSFYNEKNECIFQALIKRFEENETDKGNSKIVNNKTNKFYLIINQHKEKEKIIKEFNYLESDITYLICFHLNNSFVNIYIYPILGIIPKIINSHSDMKFNFQEERINLKVGFDSVNGKNEYFSGYIGYFHIIQIYNANKNKIDYENNKNIIVNILLLKEYYKYLIFYLKDIGENNSSVISLDYISHFKNKNDMFQAQKRLEDINKESKNYYKTILFLSPENINIKKSIILSIEKEFNFNDINITFVKFENSREVFLMKNGLSLFCLQFEYLFQFANYYLKKIQHSDTILSSLKFEENLEISLKLIGSNINSILMILSKYIIDLNIRNFFPELKQIFSTLFSTIISLSNIDCIIDIIFHQLNSIFIIICEQIKLICEKKKNNSISNEEKNDLEFLIGLRDSIIDILLTKPLYQKAKPKFIETLFPKIIVAIEINNENEITSSHPNIFLKALSFSEILNDYLIKYQSDLYKDHKNLKKIKIVNDYLTLLKGLFNQTKEIANKKIFLQRLISYTLKESVENISQSYMFFTFINDLLKEVFFEDKEIDELIRYFKNLCESEINGDDKNDLSKIVITILLKCIFEKNQNKNFTNFHREIKELNLNDDLVIYIINEILTIFSNIDEKSPIKIIIFDENNNKKARKISNANDKISYNFDYNSFFDNLFEFILLLLRKYFNKKDIPLSNDQKNKHESLKESKFELHLDQNKPNRIILEIVNLIFFIEEMANAYIINNPNRSIKISTVFSLLNIIKFIYILVFDEKLIELLNEEKFNVIIENTIECCIQSKIIYTNILLTLSEKNLIITNLKTIPETLLDILMHLINSDVIKNNKDESEEKNKKGNYITNNDIIRYLNDIFLIKKKSTGQKTEENKKSLFCYNDIYRYFFSKKITNEETELKEINKNKILMKHFPKFGFDFIYLYNINVILVGTKKFKYNFITFNTEKIYKYNKNVDASGNQELKEFFDTLLNITITEHEILFELNKKFFFEKNSGHTNYNQLINRIEHLYSNRKKLETIEIKIYLDKTYFEKNFINIEYINSGQCDNIKEKKGKNKIKFDNNKNTEDNDDQNRIIIHSSKQILNSPSDISSEISKSAKTEEIPSLSSINSSDTESIHNEENKSENESFSNTTDSNEVENLSNSYRTLSNANFKKGIISKNSSCSSLLSLEPNTNINIDINKYNLDSSSSKTSLNNKNQLEDDLNCNFLNKLDSMYLFNVKRDLIKNIFSLNFLDTIFYDKNFIELRKLFYQMYDASSLDSKTSNIPTLNYPTKIKNFSNGVEPSLFLSPYKDFYIQKTFPITHEYFNEFIKNNKIKFKDDNINLVEKQIFIPSGTYNYNCELIKINKVYYGTIMYSKAFSYLYFEQRNFEEIYNKNKNTYDYEGFFSLSTIKLADKSNTKNKTKFKSNKLFHKNKQVLILFGEIQEIVERRFLLMWQGLEIYLKDGRSYFFNLLEQKKYTRFKNRLLENEDLRRVFHTKDYLTKNKYITQAWKKDNITTYEYLLLLNKYASRSFNDSGQYHVFPWIISRFENFIYINRDKNRLAIEKSQLNNINDLEKENNKNEKNLILSLRDLKYPPSLQNQEARDSAIFRFNDGEAHFKFHLGTHYSNSAFIFYYLMRQEPYNTQLIKLQSYQCENPNRMFIGLKETIEILQTGNDNRELIPEFFGKIEYFMNLNYCFYGKKATDKIVNDVRINFMKHNTDLPLQISDYVHFIIIHRNVLNSNLIDLSIHDWINNIFGIGQYPPKKYQKNCCNIYRKTTYEKHMNLLEKIGHYKEKRGRNYESKEIRFKLLNKANSIISFGQTPYQIFSEAHPIKTIKGSSDKEKDDKNSLSYKKNYNMEENREEDDFSSISNLLRPSKKYSKINYPCIYFDVNLENNKIFALSENEMVEINFTLNDGNDLDILILSYQKAYKIKPIKLFENFNFKGIEYYVYKPKYAFSSFKRYEYLFNFSRKGSVMSKGSKNSRNVISLDENFNFNDYYKNLFEKMNIKKNIDDPNEENNKIILCRYLDNSFKIYRITKSKIQKKKINISMTSFSYLCEDFVSSCCTINDNQFLTGLDNGKLIKWKIIKEEKNKIEIKFLKNIQAHKSRINAIEIDQRLGLIITCGKDNLVQIRKLYNLELITPIKIKKKYVVVMAKVSPINFLYILCFDMKKRRSIIYGYTLTGIKFAKNKGGLYCNIDFTRSGNIVSLMDNKELCIFNSYDLTKKENISKKIHHQDDLGELKKIEGASWLEFNYFVKKLDKDNDSSDRIINAVIYVKKSKNKENDNMIFYYNFKDNQIFE